MNSAAIVQKVHAHVVELRRLLDGSVDIPGMPALRDSLEDVTELSRAGPIPIDLVWSGEADADLVATVARWASREDPTITAEIAERGIHEIGAARIGAIRAPIALVVLDGAADSAANCSDELGKWLRGRALGMVIGGAQAPDREIISQPVAFRHLQRGELTPGHLFAKAEDPDHARSLLVAFSTTGSLRSIEKAARLAIETEVRELEAKKTLAQQELRFAQATAKSASTELLKELKSRVGDQVRELEQGFVRRSEDLTAPGIGSIWPQVDEVLAKLESLDEQEGAKTIRVTIPTGYQRVAVAEVRGIIEAHMMSDIRISQDAVQLVNQTVADRLAKEGVPCPPLEAGQVDPREATRILDSAFRIERRYSAERRKRGFYEYFMIARRYQMLAYILITTLGLSFVRGYMVMVSVVLLTVGAIRVRKTLQEERVETEAKEVESAREQLRAEFRRAVGEVQRAWTSQLSAHVKEQAAKSMSAVESAVRQHKTTQDEASRRAGRRLKHRLQTLEATARQLNELARMWSAASSAIRDTQAKLKPIARTLLRGLARAQQ